MTSTSILAPASVISHGRFFRSERQKPLPSHSPPSIYFLVIYDKICGFLFLLFFICDLNKQSGTSLFHILWTYYEISALKTLTRSHIFVKYYKVILLRFCSYYLEHLNYLNYRNYLNYLNYVYFLKYLNYFNYLNYPNHLNNLNYFNYHMNMKMNMSMDMIMNMNINMNTNMNMNMNMIALIQNNFYSEKLLLFRKTPIHNNSHSE